MYGQGGGANPRLLWGGVFASVILLAVGVAGNGIVAPISFGNNVALTAASAGASSPESYCLSGNQANQGIETQCVPGCTYDLVESTSGGLTLKVIKAPAPGTPQSALPPGQVYYETFYTGTQIRTCASGQSIGAPVGLNSASYAARYGSFGVQTLHNASLSTPAFTAPDALVGAGQANGPPVNILPQSQNANYMPGAVTSEPLPPVSSGATQSASGNSSSGDLIQQMGFSNQQDIPGPPPPKPPTPAYFNVGTEAQLQNGTLPPNDFSNTVNMLSPGGGVEETVRIAPGVTSASTPAPSEAGLSNGVLPAGTEINPPSTQSFSAPSPVSNNEASLANDLNTLSNFFSRIGSFLGGLLPQTFTPSTNPSAPSPQSAPVQQPATPPAPNPGSATLSI